LSDDFGFPGLIRMPSEAFEEVEPIVGADGKVLRRFRLKGTDLIGEEAPSQTFKCEVTEIKPMDVPDSLLFFQEFMYKGSDK
jgi:hypothetical protein